jgi:hypothetical protein
MSFQSVVSDVRGRAEDLGAQTQRVAKISYEVLTQAGEIVVDGVHSLVKGQTEAAKDLFESAWSGFEKARADGLKAVASAPISYLPPRDKLLGVVTETVEVVSKTGEELYKAFKDGFVSLASEVEETVEKGTARAKATVKKASASVKKSAKITQAKAAG